MLFYAKKGTSMMQNFLGKHSPFIGVEKKGKSLLKDERRLSLYIFIYVFFYTSIASA